MSESVKVELVPEETHHIVWVWLAVNDGYRWASAYATREEAMRCKPKSYAPGVRTERALFKVHLPLDALREVGIPVAEAEEV